MTPNTNTKNPFRFAYLLFNPSQIVSVEKLVVNRPRNTKDFFLVVTTTVGTGVSIRYTDEIALEAGLQDFLKAWVGEVAVAIDNNLRVVDNPPALVGNVPSSLPGAATQLTPEQVQELRLLADLNSPDVQALKRLVASLSAAQHQALLNLIFEIENNL
jgi:hypothetical protein